ncbi:MAG: chemotaxis protein CheA, partial [Nitrospirae bacterium]|nr:chemotaxis protein CheA [Nitrospirota bacterium]
MTANLDYFNKDEYEELRKVFFCEAYELVEDIQDGLLMLEDNPAEEETLIALQRYFHTLKGDSNSIGLTDVGAVCHRIEDVLTSFRSKTREIDSSGITLLLQTLDNITHQLKAGESGSNGVNISETMAMIDGFLGSNGTEDRDGVIAKDEVLKQSKNEIPRSARNDMERARNDGICKEFNQPGEAAEEDKGLYNVEIVFHPQCAERGVAALMINSRLETLGEIIGSTPDLTGAEVEASEKIMIILKTDKNPEEIKKILSITGITNLINIAHHIASQPINVADKEEHQGASACASADRQEDVKGTRLQSETLRVEASKVDLLMNLAGELIISRSTIDQIARDAEGGLSSEDIAPRLLSVNSFMERTVSDMQKAIMMMRMVPINHVFRKFPKIVRELSNEKGKQVRLEIEGREVELDKGIVDALGEPLIHIIRNSIDHGIETPEDRVSTGKPREGTLALKAYHEATQIIIEISDDGKGIDPERLKQKAVEKGFISKEDAERLSQREAINLIFLSGLSTSETISDISGRGIGMDAVKAAVTNMKGAIEVESSLEKGTKFRLMLPLTLAVIRALLVEASERLYAIPISAVTEVARIMEDELTGINGKEAIILRDQVISMVRLSGLFRLQEEAKRAKKFGIILGAGSK